MGNTVHILGYNMLPDACQTMSYNMIHLQGLPEPTVYMHPGLSYISTYHRMLLQMMQYPPTVAYY